MVPFTVKHFDALWAQFFDHLKIWLDRLRTTVVQSRRSDSSGDCSDPKCGSTFAETAFSYKADKESNKLPINLKTCMEFDMFSCKVKNGFLPHQSCQH